MLGLMVVGLLWVVVYYISQTSYPIPGIGNWNLLIGFGLLLIGFGDDHPLALTTRSVDLEGPAAAPRRAGPSYVRSASSTGLLTAVELHRCYPHRRSTVWRADVAATSGSPRAASELTRSRPRPPAEHVRRPRPATTAPRQRSQRRPRSCGGGRPDDGRDRSPVTNPPRCACQAIPGRKPSTALIRSSATMPATSRPSSPVHHEQRTEQPEHRTRRTHGLGPPGDRVARVGEHVHADRPADRAEQVEHRELRAPEQPLEVRADHPQRVEVERRCAAGTSVECRNAARHEAVGLRDRLRRVEVEPSGHRSCARELQQEQPHADRHDGQRDDRPTAASAARRTRSGRAPAARLRADAVHALHARRRGPLALRADRPLAPLAADVRDAVRDAGGRPGLLGGLPGVRRGGVVVTPARPSPSRSRRARPARRRGRCASPAMASTTWRPAASATWPKIVCLPCRCGVGTDGDEELGAVGARPPRLPAFAMASTYGAGEVQAGVDLVVEGVARGRRSRCPAGRRPGS